MIDIIANIEAIRKEKGLKQSELGKKLGTSQSGYSNFINRNPDMPFSRISQIADILGVSVVDIVTYPEKYVPESQQPKPCASCAEKDTIIANLNKYIAVLEKKQQKK